MKLFLWFMLATGLLQLTLGCSSPATAQASRTGQQVVTPVYESSGGS